MLDIIGRMLNNKKNKRYNTAEEVLLDLETLSSIWDIQINKNNFKVETEVDIITSADETLQDDAIQDQKIIVDDTPPQNLFISTVMNIEEKLNEIMAKSNNVFEAPEAFKELRVFISSTMEDLQPERDAVEKALRELGLTVLRAESFGSPGLSSNEQCMRIARDCDLYIGIIGLRFGWAPPYETRSVTEMEYDTARSVNNQKVLIYLKSGEPEEDQKRFRQKVSDFNVGYFRPTFTTVEELYKLIKTDIPTWMINRIKRV
jgi:hypothetical protein